MDNLIGKDLGRYHILEKLGEGGMATVYKAYDTRLEREVALKVIRKEAFPPEQLERVLKRFEREAKALAKMSHANIVKVHDYGEHDGAPYLVMENLSGGTLKERLGQPVSYIEAARLLTPVARALGYAHQQGILHRDVKPSNILITHSGEPVLTDFGIAKLLESAEGHTLTGTGVGVGTPEYMAPEQGLGKEIDGRADVYALGIVFYELVTGRKPYTADTPMAVLLKQFNDPLPRPRDFAPGLPEAVEKVLFKALSKRPEDRYADMDSFTRALEKLAAKAGEEMPYSKIKPAPHPRGAASNADPNATYDDLAMPAEPRIPLRQQESKPVRHGWGLPAKILIGVGLVAGAALLLGALNITGLLGNDAGAQTTFDESGSQATLATATSSPAPPAESKGWIGGTQTREIDQMPLVYVPSGAFLMGSENGDKDESPEHFVRLDAFWIDKTEVTNAQYASFLNEMGNQNESGTPWLDAWDGDVRIHQNSGKWQADSEFADHPVIEVSWYGAKAYCEWAGGRLPTEAEWEKAARGTDGQTFPWGEDILDCQHAQFYACKGGTIPVGSLTAGASPYGALGMAGNVWEWTSTQYKEYPYDPNDGRGEPTGARVLRGGSWSSDERLIRAANRLMEFPDRANDYGFRCVSD